MRERQFPAEQNDPQDVAEGRACSGIGSPNDPASERPQREGGDPEGREPERDGDDQDERDYSGERVQERQPKAGQNEPDEVEDETQSLDSIVGRLSSKDYADSNRV